MFNLLWICVIIKITAITVSFNQPIAMKVALFERISVIIIITKLVLLSYYVLIECGQGSGESGCGIPKLYTSTCGEIKLHQKSQNTGHTCEFQIHVDEQFRIKLSIVKFETLDTG